MVGPRAVQRGPARADCRHRGRDRIRVGLAGLRRRGPGGVGDAALPERDLAEAQGLGVGGEPVGIMPVTGTPGPRLITTTYVSAMATTTARPPASDASSTLRRPPRGRACPPPPEEAAPGPPGPGGCCGSNPGTG